MNQVNIDESTTLRENGSLAPALQTTGAGLAMLSANSHLIAFLHYTAQIISAIQVRTTTAGKRLIEEILLSFIPTHSMTTPWD